MPFKKNISASPVVHNGEASTLYLSWKKISAGGVKKILTTSFLSSPSVLGSWDLCLIIFFSECGTFWHCLENGQYFPRFCIKIALARIALTLRIGLQNSHYCLVFNTKLRVTYLVVFLLVLWCKSNFHCDSDCKLLLLLLYWHLGCQ